jgi:arylsulfatase A-like enzyme
MNWTFTGGVMAAGLGLLLAATDSPAQVPAAKPHIVILLADDMGWGDTGFHGSEIHTPHIDRLAAAGARLEQFYVQPVCSPTRAALMTGRYPMRYGLQVGVVRPWARYGLPLEERTLAQALKDAGYETAICGKWHLGHVRPEYLPTRRGFDHQYGHYNGAIDYFTHHRDGGLDWHRDDKALREDGYSTTLIAQEACRLIRQRDRSKPLFLYVPFNAVHEPRQVPASYTAPYTRLKEPRRTYAGMVAALDEAIGRTLATLDEAGMRKDTLVIFFSDNGGPAPGRVTSNGPFRAGKGTLYEGGMRVVACTAWEGHVKPGTVVNAPLHVVDWYPTLRKLAGASLDQKFPLDGRDAWATIAEGKPSPHAEILLNSTPRNGALRVGDWKLVLNGNRTDDGTSVSGEGAKEAVELFNLAEDPAEKRNRATDRTDEVKELRARYEALARQAVPPKSAPKPADYQALKVWGETE